MPTPDDDPVDGSHRRPAGASPDLAVLGLGPMGAPIARRLMAAGPLTVWNRTAEKTAPFRAAGALVASTPAEAARAIVITVLPDLPEVEQVLTGPDGLLAGWQQAGVPRPVLVVHGTVSPARIRAFAAHLADERVQVVDAPLSGGTVGAAAGSLSVMVGGDPMDVQALDPVFAQYAATVRHFGPVGTGATAKVCNQIVVASTVAALSEALALARRSGLDQQHLIDVLRAGLAGSTVLEQKSEKWLTDDYSEGGSASNQLKDLRFAGDSARAADLQLTLTAATTALFTAMVDRGDGALDHSGIIRTILQEQPA